MTAAILVFLLLVGGLLQSLTPATPWLGASKPPFLMAVVLYYALVHSRGMALAAALLAGIMQDSLSLLPLGYSPLCFVAFTLVVVRARETLFRDSLFTVAMLGAWLSALTTLALYLLLRVSDFEMNCSPGWMGLKMGGSALLGLAVAPLVWALASALERHVGMSVTEDG